MMQDDLLDFLGDLFLKGQYQKRFGITFLQFLETCTCQADYYHLSRRTLFQQWQSESFKERGERIIEQSNQSSRSH